MNYAMLTLDNMEFEILTSGDQNSDKLALLLHGFPECAHDWRNQMQILAGMGYKCWAPNQRGYGKSYSPPEVSAYYMDYLMADVARFIKASNCKTVTLIGHDWGAIVAWNYAIQKAGPLDKLVIMNVPHPSIALRELKKWKQLKKLWYFFMFQIPKLPEYLLTKNNGANFVRFLKKGIKQLKPDDLQVYLENALRPGGMRAMINWYRAFFRSLSSSRKKLQSHAKGKLQVPTLMVWGEKDVVLGVNMCQGTEKYVEDLTIRYIPDAGHFVQEDAPDQVNAILKAWLEGKAVPGAKTPIAKGIE